MCHSYICSCLEHHWLRCTWSNGQSLSTVPKPQSEEDTKLSTEIQQTGGEERTHIEEASKNGVVPVVTEVNKETEAPKTVNGLSEHREEEAPVIEKTEVGRGEQDERGPAENGIQEVNRREESTGHPEDVSIYISVGIIIEVYVVLVESSLPCVYRGVWS